MKDVEKFKEMLDLYSELCYNNLPEAVEIEKELIKMYKED